VTHLGPRLSALIDGELDGSERERVLWHMTKCGSCRDEAAALRTLKRRVNALHEAAAGAGMAGLTGRLMSLSDVLRLDDPRSALDGSAPGTIWPPPPPAGGWPLGEHGGQDATAIDRGSRPDQRAARYFLAGSLVVFLAGLGTAAFIVGGETQARAPTPPVTPSIDVLVQTSPGTQPGTGFRPAAVRPELQLKQPLPAGAMPHRP
jgi:anti-sigma factor RsiW